MTDVAKFQAELTLGYGHCENTDEYCLFAHPGAGLYRLSAVP